MWELSSTQMHPNVANIALSQTLGSLLLPKLVKLVSNGPWILSLHEAVAAEQCKKWRTNSELAPS